MKTYRQLHDSITCITLHAGCVVAGMFSDGSYPLLKYMYDRHAATYAAVPHSKFKPYASMKTPACIHAKVKK